MKTPEEIQEFAREFHRNPIIGGPIPSSTAMKLAAEVVRLADAQASSEPSGFAPVYTEPFRWAVVYPDGSIGMHMNVGEAQMHQKNAQESGKDVSVAPLYIGKTYHGGKPEPLDRNPVVYADDYSDIASALEDAAEKLRELDEVHRSLGDANAMTMLRSVANELVHDGKGNLSEKIWSAMDKIKAVRNMERKYINRKPFGWVLNSGVLDAPKMTTDPDRVAKWRANGYKPISLFIDDECEPEGEVDEG